MERSPETYQAIIEAYKALSRSAYRHFLSEGLTPSQYGVLRALARNGPMTMKKLSREMLVTPPNMTGMVGRLEARGLARRLPDGGDRRNVIIALTPAGEKVQEALARGYRDFLKAALGALTSEEQETLASLLTKLRDEISTGL